MSHNTLRTLSIGRATVSVINVGDILFTIAEMLNFSDRQLPPGYAHVFEQAELFPTQCVHIALAEASILVDASNYALSFSPDSPYRPPHYQPPPDLISQLRQEGIQPEDITHLIITHAHLDHYSGVTMKRNGQYVPSFPNARCFLGRADWEMRETQDALQSPDSIDSHTLGVLHKAGLLELVDGNLDVAPSVQIIAAPGESPGHQIVRVCSEGQTLYCLGDLFHHTIEIEQPHWMAQWANVEKNLSSRHALLEVALRENAALIAAHMPVGRLENTSSGIRWMEI